MPFGYWTIEDERDLENTKNFVDLYKIAKRVLARMPDNLCMVCGPITSGGLYSIVKNLHVFAAHIARLENRGMNVFNQMPFESAMDRIRSLPGNGNEDLLLNDFYLPLFRTGRIRDFYFIPGWRSSYGAQWEHTRAIELGIRRHYLRKKLRCCK